MGQRNRRKVEAVTNAALTVTPPGQVVRSVIHGQPVQFFIANPRDEIQRVHATGRFYEEAELEIIRKWCPPGAVFLDIGSNVGNHAIYAAKFLHASHVVLCEPNPVAIEILMANLGLNGVLDRCDTSKLGFGISDRDDDGLVIRAHHRNLGGGRIEPSGDDDGEGGGICVRRGDDLLADVTPDFVKIDVEGMEVAVLAGLSGLLERSRPTIFIEVDNQNRQAFFDWLKENSYTVRARHRRYRANENFLITSDVPRSRPDATTSAARPTAESLVQTATADSSAENMSTQPASPPASELTSPHGQAAGATAPGPAAQSRKAPAKSSAKASPGKSSTSQKRTG